MGVDSIILSGFKSFRERTEVALGDLTILAGANSAGKSTLMQSLLLMKQTLEASYDPGPLLLSGPNIIFSSAKQLFWNAPGDQAKELTLGVKLYNRSRSGGYEVVLQQHKAATLPLRIARAVMYDAGNAREELSPTLSPEERSRYEAEFRKTFPEKWFTQRYNESAFHIDIEVVRERMFLRLEAKLVAPDIKEGAFSYGRRSYEIHADLRKAIRGLIHVPGLRGNPRRTYPVTAVEHNFPGLFPDYVASVIATWQRSHTDKINQLKEDLKELGLAWNVQARNLNDTEVEIRVTRLPRGIRSGARDMVNIADVGFGLSQSLPVVVALLAARPEQLVYLEQPEIHLHPRAAYQLSRLLQRAVMRGVQVVIETHSELLLLGLQELVANGQFGDKKILLHWVQRDQRGASYLTSHKLDEKGGFGDAPVDFALVSLEAMHNYLSVAGG